jgi:amidase
MTEDLTDLDAVACAEMIRRGDASPLDLVDAAIARIEKLDPEINAIPIRRFEKAREEAASPDLLEGPFRGVPTVVKDLWSHTAGDPFHKGMRFLKELGWTEKEDTTHAARLRAAGFVFVGRSNTPEMGLQPTTEPEAYGPTRNPWNLGHSTGGSSGGAAAALVCRMVPIAQATDGGGSIRIPASECGVFGLKPTRGRVSCGPVSGDYTGGFSVELCVSNTVRDTAAYLDVVEGPGVGDPYVAPPPLRSYVEEVGAPPGRLRIGVLDHDPRGFATVHPDVVRATREAAELLGSLGHHVEDAYPPALAEAEVATGVITFFGTSVAAGLDHWSARTGKPITQDDVEAPTWALAEMGRAITGPQFWLAREQTFSHARRVARWWADGFDLLLTPTLAEPPPPLGYFRGTPENPLGGLARGASFALFTAPFNASGQPAVSLPLGTSSDGLPIGVQLVAAFGREDVLIRVAAQIEEAAPWIDRRPAIA